MKFLIDTQLPAKLAELLRAAGHDVVHTSQLPEGNRTTDAALATLADQEERVVVTKDRDFRDTHLLRPLTSSAAGGSYGQHHQQRLARLVRRQPWNRRRCPERGELRRTRLNGSRDP